MRLWEKISLSIILVFISGFIAFGVWQSDNIRTVFLVLTRTSEQLAAEMDANKKRLEEELVKKHPTIISDFTAEEEKQIMKGEISYEEAAEIISKKFEEKIAELNADNLYAENYENQNKSHDGKTSEKYSNKVSQQNEIDIQNIDVIVGDKIVRLYSLKALYLGRLGQLEAQVKRDYSKMPKEQRNVIGKKTLADKYMGVALGYMERCDAEVATLLTELKSELESANADTSIIGKINEAYENEKTIKKAYYLKLLGE